MKQEFKVLLVRVESDKYRKLKKLSFLKELSMSELVRQGIEVILNNDKNVLTNSDIVIS